MSYSQIENQTRGVVEQFLEALGERNVEQLIPLFNDKVDWFIPGNQDLAPWTGRRENKREIIDVFELLWKHTEPVSVKISHTFIENTSAEVVGAFQTRMLATGAIVDSPFSIYLTVEKRLIIKYRLLEDSYAVSSALEE